MTDREAREMCIRAINNSVAGAQDNAYRARSAFSGLSKDEMKQPYGHSGYTKAEILAEYEQTEARWAEVFAWFLKTCPS